MLHILYVAATPIIQRAACNDDNSSLCIQIATTTSVTNQWQSKRK